MPSFHLRHSSLSLSIAIILLSASTTAVAQTRAAATASETPTSRMIPTPNMDSIFGSFKLDRLGGELVSIWNDRQEGSRYYYLPSLLPEWRAFESRVNQKCINLEGNNRVKVNLRIYLNDEYYQDEIRERIAHLADLQSLDEHQLSALPHDNIQIVMKGSTDREARLIYDLRGRSHSLDDPNVPQVLLVAYPREIEVPITDSCISLKEIAIGARQGEDILSGRIYYHGIVYETTSFSAQLSKYLNSEKASTLFGDETLVRKVSYSNELGFGDDDAGKKLLFRLPFLSHSGNAEASRKRLLSRNYVNYVSSQSFTRMAGGCVEASRKSTKCAELRQLFLDFLISHTKTIEVTFRELEAGSFELVADQLGYATLSPEQYQTVASAAPTFEGSADGETVQYADKITWDFSGKEPIPTKATLRLLDEQALRADVSIYWYEKVPVNDGSSRVVANLSYFPVRIADSKILPLEQFVEWVKQKQSCQEGSKIVALKRHNVWASPRNNRGVGSDFRSITHSDRSSRCDIRFRGGWKASGGHFFLLEEDSDLVTVPWRLARGGWTFTRSWKAHVRNVPRGDGSAQMLEEVAYSARAERGYRVFGRLTCGATVRLDLQQYPVSCAPFLVNGYGNIHRVSGMSSVE